MRVHWRLFAILVAGVLLLVTGIRAMSASDNRTVIGGPLALLLASSTDLGPSRDDSAQLTLTLPDRARPDRLIEWAGAHGIRVRIPRPGLCTDNGAMVAALGAELVRRGRAPSALDLPADSSMPVTTVVA